MRKRKRKQMEPSVVNGSVHIGRKRRQICVLASSVDWALLTLHVQAQMLNCELWKISTTLLIFSSLRTSDVGGRYAFHRKRRTGTGQQMASEFNKEKQHQFTSVTQRLILQRKERSLKTYRRICRYSRGSRPSYSPSRRGKTRASTRRL